MRILFLSVSCDNPHGDLLKIFALCTVYAAASYSFSESKAFNFYTQGEVIKRECALRSEFRARQSLFEFSNRYYKWRFDSVLSFAEEIHVRLFGVRDNNLNSNDPTFQIPERLQP